MIHATAAKMTDSGQVEGLTALTLPTKDRLLEEHAIEISLEKTLEERHRISSKCSSRRIVKAMPGPELNL